MLEKEPRKMFRKSAKQEHPEELAKVKYPQGVSLFGRPFYGQTVAFLFYDRKTSCSKKNKFFKLSFFFIFLNKRKILPFS